MEDEVDGKTKTEREKWKKVRKGQRKANEG
jgi:hypothetical protein